MTDLNALAERLEGRTTLDDMALNALLREAAQALRGMEEAARIEREALEDRAFEAHYIDVRDGHRKKPFDAAHWEQLARTLSARLRQMDKRAKAANARADAARSALKGGGAGE